MAEQEEDFSSLPLPDRFIHKNWKVRKQGYEDAAKEFEATPDESHPAFRPFLQDPSLWKGAVADSNVAAQQDGINALCSFLKYGGHQACTRTRNSTVSPIVEKGLSSTRVATKQSALEALLLYIELDKADPVIDDLLPHFSHKQPKIIAATLSTTTAIFHAYGVKIANPKPVLKALPALFGHADKNVRAEASNLAVELYRWLREAIKSLFWNDLKPVQQQDLEKLFEVVKQEPPPKQERLLRSQQEAKITPSNATDGEAPEEEGEAEAVEVDLSEPVEVYSKVPKDLHENLASTKWKDRKEALDALHAILNVERIVEGPFDEIVSALAKCMKDANIAVVTVAANCIDALAKGLRKGFAKYRSRVMGPMMERLKEKKQSVADALGSALDSVFVSTGLSECLEEILEYLKHKNPQVKQETLKFLIRSLKTTRAVPSKEELKALADMATKLLTESTEGIRLGGAEVLGTLMKIMGERMMGPYLEGLDDIRKTKIKEYFDSAEVKAKYRPKPVGPPPKAASAVAPVKKKVFGQKAVSAAKKTAPRAVSPLEDEPTPTPLKSRPMAGKSIPSKLTGPTKSGLAAPSGGPKLQRRLVGPSAIASPTSKRALASPDNFQDAPVPKPGPVGRGLAGRPLGKPVPPTTSDSTTALGPPQPAGMSAAERAELDELRAQRDRLTRTAEDLRATHSKLSSQINELQNQNAQLIEDHTRDVLSIKAKETQLVRARSDAEAAEQMVQKQGKEMERLKRELSREVRASNDSPPSFGTGDGIYRDSSGSNGANGLPATSPHHQPAMERYHSSGGGGSAAMSQSRDVGYQRAKSYMNSPSEEKENGGGMGLVADGTDKVRAGYPPQPHKREMSAASSGSGSRVGRQEAEGGSGGAGANGEPVESWKRAAEVTNQLKARIELMKARQGLARPH